MAITPNRNGFFAVIERRNDFAANRSGGFLSAAIPSAIGTINVVVTSYARCEAEILAKVPAQPLAELQRAVALRPAYWRNYQSLGVFYLRSGRTNDAVTTFSRLIELKPAAEMT